MDHRGEVEFLPDDGRPEVGEKVLPTRQRIRPPRWMWLAVVGVAVLLIAAFLGRHASPTHRRANPSIQAGPSGGIASQAPPSVGQPLPLAAGGPAIDLAMAGRVTWVLQPRRITVVDDLVARRATADWPGVPAQDFAVLRVDPSHAELWIITEGASRGRVLEYDAYTLARVRDLVLPTINGAAALGGHLYVTSRARLIDVAPHAPPKTVAAVHTRGGLGPVAADPAADRLIILDTGFPTLVRIYRPRGGLSRPTSTLALTKASLAISSRAVWVGGFRTGGAALWRLDGPVHRVVQESPLRGELGPGAVVVASGQAVFWVRNGASGDDLWCVDASSGRPVHHWVTPGVVASTAGAAVVATSSGAAPLFLRGCAG